MNTSAANLVAIEKQFKIRHFVHGRDTTKCEVSFQLCKEKMKIVKEYFTKLHGKNGNNLIFKSCKIFWRGCGWFKVKGRNAKINGALDAIKHVVNALKIHAGLLVSTITKQPAIAVVLPSRYKIVARISKFNKVRLVNLAVEAARNFYAESLDKFNTWFKDERNTSLYNTNKKAEQKVTKQITVTTKLDKMVKHLSQFHHA